MVSTIDSKFVDLKVLDGTRLGRDKFGCSELAQCVLEVKSVAHTPFFHDCALDFMGLR